MDIKQRVLNRIEEHLDEYVDFLKEIVAKDTQCLEEGRRGNEDNGQEVIIAMLKRLKAEVDVFEPDYELMNKSPEVNKNHNYEGRHNVVGIFKGSGNGKSLLFNGHIDTVEFGNLDMWDHHPLSPVIKDGKLYGRGSCDMKAGLCAALMAIKAIVDCGISLKGDVIYESVLDEEGGGNGTLDCCMRGYKADAAIVPEPTNLLIAPGHMGVLHYKITVEGKACHGGAKWKGINAIDKAVKVMLALYEAESEWTLTRTHSYLPPQTMGVNMINGGTRVSIVPNSCEMQLSNHFLPHKEPGYSWDGEKFDKEIRDVIRRAAMSDTWLSEHPPKVELIQKGGACDIGKGHPICQVLSQNGEMVLGKEPEKIGLVSGADTRLIVNYANTPAVTFGPGTIEVAHSYNEYVSLDEYYNCIKILALSIMDWCGYNE